MDPPLPPPHAPRSAPWGVIASMCKKLCSQAHAWERGAKVQRPDLSVATGVWSLYVQDSSWTGLPLDVGSPDVVSYPFTLDMSSVTLVWRRCWTLRAS